MDETGLKGGVPLVTVDGHTFPASRVKSVGPVEETTYYGGNAPPAFRSFAFVVQTEIGSFRESALSMGSRDGKSELEKRRAGILDQTWGSKGEGVKDV